jgi:hypothetical protein
MSEVQPKSRRGRKPKIKPEDSVKQEMIVKKKRGRKKKCEMNLENIPKISGYNPTGDSIDTEDNKVKFGTNNQETYDNCENLSFGVLQIKRHNVVRKVAAPVDVPCCYENKECIINFDLIVDNIVETVVIDTKLNVKAEHNLSNFFDVKPQDKIINYSKSDTKTIKNVIDDSNNKIHGRNTKYIKILGRYRGKDVNIPTKTDICCWWCCHEFDGIPRFMPTQYDQVRNRFKVTGNFCSWSCVRSFFLNEPKYTGGINSILLTALIRTIHGRSYNVPTAPPRCALIKFGGKLTIEQFRSTDKNIYYEINTNRITMDESYYIREIETTKR